MPTFDTLQGSVNLRAQATAQATGGGDALALVGGYDATAASASANDPVTATDAQTIADAFGPDSELARASRLALANGAGTIVAVAVPEVTDETETFSATSSEMLANAPIFDPSLHADHEVTATDTTSATSVTVEVSYEDSPSAPTDADTIRLNPINGAWTADASSDYEIVYDYGTYTDAIQTAATQPVRYVGVLTEAAGPKATTLTELATEAENGSYKRAVVGATPEIGTGEISGYTPDEQDYRLIEVAPARATGADGPVRTMAGVAGLLTDQPVNAGGSITYDTVSGLASLNTEYRQAAVQDFSQVTALTRDGTVADGVTTSSDNAFQPIHAVEIADRATELIFGLARDFAGGPATQQNRIGLADDIEQVLRALATESPPALATGDGGSPFAVSVTQGATDNVVDVDVGIEPAPIAEEVNVAIGVGDVVTFEGVN